MTDDARVDSREVMSGEEMERIYKDVPALAELARLQLRAILDAALSRYAAKMGVSGRRVEGFITESRAAMVDGPQNTLAWMQKERTVEFDTPVTVYIHEPPKPECPPHEWGGIACATCGMPKPAKPAEERIREALAFVDRRRWEEDSLCVRMARILRGEGGR